MRTAPFLLVVCGCAGFRPDSPPAPPAIAYGFEASATDGTPLGWRMRGGEYAVVDECAHGGRQSLRLRADGRDDLAAATIELPAAGLVGKRVRVSTWLRTRDVMDTATPWLRADDGERAMSLAFDFPAHGTVDAWTESVAEIEVPPAKTVSFGVALIGAGTAWFDDVRVEVIEAAAATIVLGGVVTDAAGRPVANATVGLLRGSGAAQHACTDAEGRYSFRTAPGRYAVSACAPGAVTAVGNFLATAQYDTDAPRLDISLGPQGGVMVRGQVTGTPPRGSHVEVARYSNESGDTFVLPLAADGRFGALLPRGDRYRVRMLAPSPSTVDVLRSDDVAIASLPATPPPVPPQVVDWIAANTTPLAHGEAGQGLADMSPLAAIVGGATVVGLGEATHGAREMFAIKHRLIEYLVAEHGFTVIAFEGGFTECLALDRYVQGGAGDAAHLLSHLVWVWDTAEIAALVEWLRAWNADAAPDKKVHLVGIDMQESGGAYAGVAAFLRQVAPHRAAALLPPIAAMGRTYTRRAIEDLTALQQRELVVGLEALAEQFDRMAAEWTRATSPDDFAMARQMVTVMQQSVAEALTGPPGAAGQKVRDRAMADNIAWIRTRTRTARVAVWAHNYHVRADPAPAGAIRRTGSYLRERYGKDYLALGMVFGHGRFAALDANHHRNLEEITLLPAPDHYLSAAFPRAGIRRGVLDLRALPVEGAVARWFAAPRTLRESGYVFRSEDALTHDEVLPRLYDALVYVDQVTRCRANPPDRARLP